jgi:hypothetical protein
VSDISPRETMRPIWSPFQRGLTRLAGVPLEGEELKVLTPWSHLRGALGFLATGVSLSGLSAATLSPMTAPFLLIGWLIGLHGARKLRTIIMHQAAHGNFIQDIQFDRRLGKTIAFGLVAEEFDGYKRSHCGDHHSARHQTLADPTVAFLFDELGLRPGMSPREMWRRLFVTVLSPRYHARFLWSRFASHFQKTTLRYRLLFSSYIASVVLGTTAIHAWPILVLAWVIPVGILYQISTAFRLSSEHVFPAQLPAVRNRSTLGAFTLGIFIGDPCPDRTLPLFKRWMAWGWWWTRMLCFHLPCRLAFLPGDGPVHDWHHRHPIKWGLGELHPEPGP